MTKMTAAHLDAVMTGKLLCDWHFDRELALGNNEKAQAHEQWAARLSEVAAMITTQIEGADDAG